MEKFIKSIFTSSNKKGFSYEGSSDDDKNDFSPPLDDRRNMSISKSGRLRHNSKKRQSLSPEVYGEGNQPPEKPKTLEYHVNPMNAGEVRPPRKHSGDPKLRERPPAPTAAKIKTPEEEIESAFEIIDEVL